MIKNLLLRFHNKTKLKLKEESTLNSVPITWIKIFFKSYPRFKNIKLPEPKVSNKSLDSCIIKRTSFREFNDKPLTKQELSDMIFYSAGITNSENKFNWNQTRRAYPSAGARYPLELYLAIFNVEGLEKGIYHYNVKKHSLELMLPGDYRIKFYNLIKQSMIKKCSSLMLISAVFDRTRVKYGDRAYRYIFLDAGHLSQNTYLKATSLDIGCCAVGGFSDDAINKLLDLDINKEAVIYLIALGR